MAKVSKKLIDLSIIGRLFEIDSEDNYTPKEVFIEAQWETDDNADIMSSTTLITEDNDYELDENNDIMPKE
jgi:hypothetical protein